MEKWKDVPDYEGLYQVSDLGRVKSLVYGKERILKQGINAYGYPFVILCKHGKTKNFTIHRLVYEAFNGKTDLQVDHIIEGNKLDNRLSNLQAMTNRENASKHRLTINKSSKYIGVIFNKRFKKWQSSIYVNKKKRYLGTFESELEASNAYQEALPKTPQEQANSIYYPLNEQK